MKTIPRTEVNERELKSLLKSLQCGNMDVEVVVNKEFFYQIVQRAVMSFPKIWQSE